MRFYSHKSRARSKGFSIIEVLVVVAVGAILVAIVLPDVAKSRERARNEQRRADLKTIALALEKYYAKYGRYPSTCSTGGLVNNDGTKNCTSGTFNPTTVRWFYSTPPQFQSDNCPPLGSAGAACRQAGKWVPALVDEGFIANLPRDPREGKAPTVTDGTCLSTSKVSYRYRSTGAHYKLQAFCGPEGLMQGATTEDMYNPATESATTRSYIISSAVWSTRSCALYTGNDSYHQPACW